MNIFQIVKLNDLDRYYSAINEFNVDSVNEYRQNLLHESVVYDRTEIALDLLSRGININQQDYKGQTPLHYAAVYNRINLSKAIINVGGIVNIRDNYGNNSLWTAVFHAKGNYELVKLFLDNKADVFTKNNAGRSPLDFAKQINDEKLVALLTED